MTRHLILLVPLAAVALAGTACTGTSDGIAAPAHSTATDDHGPTDSASLDPCSLLDAATDLSEVGAFDGPTRKDRAGARSCVWQLKRENPAGEGLVIALDVREGQPVESLNDVGGGVRPGTINDRNAAEAPDPASNDCTLAIELDATSRIDVGIAAMDDVNAACDAAREVAYLVEPRLPEA